MKGIDDLTAAKPLAGADVIVAEGDLQPLADDTFYHHQLLGCRVVTVQGREVGIISDIVSVGESDLLVVRPEGGEEILVPCRGEICRKVDLQSKTVVIDPPDGLLDLNEI